jgi:hypothetical protein
MDLRQAVADSHRQPVRAGRHVAVDERLGQIAWRRSELTNQFSGKAAFFCLRQSAGVMRNHSAQQRFGIFDVAEVPGAVQGMESGIVQVRQVSDVVQPCRSLEQFSVFSKRIT